MARLGQIGDGQGQGEAVSQLMRTEISTKQEIELTRGQDSCTNPRWSPDGKRIAFLSSRPGPKPAKPKGRRGLMTTKPKKNPSRNCG